MVAGHTTYVERLDAALIRSGGVIMKLALRLQGYKHPALYQYLRASRLDEKEKAEEAT